MLTVGQALEEFMAYKYTLSPKTKKWYRQKLGVFAAWCDQHHHSLESLRPTHANLFLQSLMENPTPAGTRRSIQTVRGYAETITVFLNWCRSHTELLDVHVRFEVKDVNRPRADEKVVETLTAEEFHALEQACQMEYSKVLELRDRAILRVLLETGIRAGELCGLMVDDICLEEGDPHIKVVGKGRKERWVGLSAQGRLAVYRYLRRARSAPVGEEHLFLSRYKEPLTTSGLYRICSRLGEWAGVAGVHPHRFRHTFAINHARVFGDYKRLQRLMGHSTDVTRRYLEGFAEDDARRPGNWTQVDKERRY
jgi:integrase/recombinase XerD